jgi:hypothetical protein
MLSKMLVKYRNLTRSHGRYETSDQRNHNRGASLGRPDGFLLRHTLEKERLRQQFDACCGQLMQEGERPRIPGDRDARNLKRRQWIVEP